MVDNLGAQQPLEGAVNQGADTPNNNPPSKKKKWLAVSLISAIVVAGAGTGVAAVMGAFAPAPPPVVEAPAKVVPVTPKPTPTVEPPREALTVSIPEVQHMPYSEIWIPPDTGENFWQVVDPAFGYPETGGTTFVLAHACESKACTGDQFLKLVVGDTIDFMGVAYQVQDAREIMKTDIAAQDVWYYDPNRLVVITCILDAALDISEKNYFVVATRV